MVKPVPSKHSFGVRFSVSAPLGRRYIAYHSQNSENSVTAARHTHNVQDEVRLLFCDYHNIPNIYRRIPPGYEPVERLTDACRFESCRRCLAERWYNSHMKTFTYEVVLTVRVQAFDDGDAFDLVQDAFGIGENCGTNVIECEYKEL